MTNAEVILWSRLRRDLVFGHRFRRQHPIGPYVADFACVPARLIIEIDGPTHLRSGGLSHDRRRDRYLQSRGWRILRIWNDDVYKNLNAVLDEIARLVPPPPPAAAPPPQAGEERGQRDNNLAGFFAASPLRGSRLKAPRIKGGLRNVDL
jgi:very-short-patch-repair endonuclease